MREQSNKLVESLPQLAALIEAADSQGSAVWFVWQVKGVPALAEVTAEQIAAGRLGKVKPRNSAGELLGQPLDNEFPSRTAALRASERHCRFAKEARSERGHWGCWQWKDSKGQVVFQGVFPVLKPRPEVSEEPAAEEPAAE